ncbi:MAG: uroporphyrinogen decarboxylase family protein [Phycisphaerae bacterium]
MDWSRQEADFRHRRQQSGHAGAGLYHGHTFLRLVDIRGYENLMYDMADGESRLDALVEMVEAVNLDVLRRVVSWSPDWVGYPEDLDMQIGPMLSPEHFRRYIKPSYSRMMAIAREAGLPVHMHSDGDIRHLLPDLLGAGVECINLQDLVNGIDWIRDNLKGRVCIDLDVDRQKVVRFGTPKDIHELILREVRELGNPEGGLMLRVDMYYGVPLENIAALMDALEEYSTYWS